jgi:hypothetical protein
MALYPWIEARFSGDHAYHNLLDRPATSRSAPPSAPCRSPFYLVLMVAGGNDVIASVFRVDVNLMSWILRISLFVLPPVVYFITKRWCLALQRSDEELLHHGIESGTIRRLPTGEFVEETVPLPVPHRIALTRVEPDHAAITDGSNPGGPATARSRCTRTSRRRSAASSAPATVATRPRPRSPARSRRCRRAASRPSRSSPRVHRLGPVTSGDGAEPRLGPARERDASVRVPARRPGRLIRRLRWTWV